MARFLVTAMPFTGHVAPLCAVAAELVARGHDVRFYTGAAFRSKVGGDRRDLRGLAALRRTSTRTIFRPLSRASSARRASAS